MNINHITKLQSRQTGQAGLRFKQLLCGRPHWGAWKEIIEKCMLIQLLYVFMGKNILVII